MTPWELPESAVVNGREYEVRSDFRACLDVLSVLGDRTLGDEERGHVAMSVFYPGFSSMPPGDVQEAAGWMQRFLAGGEPDRRPRPKLIDWAQDFPLIVNPVNRVLGYEVRERGHVHWWTFLAAYAEIGDCLLAQVVAIRRKLARGEKLDKADRQFYRENARLVDFEVAETPEDARVFEEWIV